jgi:hypothetical protein
MYDIQRAIRLYMPRTYQDLIAGFDVIVLDNANRGNLANKHIELLARSVVEGETGLIMGGGWESFGGSGPAHPPWGPTAIGQLLPTEDIEGTWAESGHLVVVDGSHEFMSSIPWQRRAPFMDWWHHNLVTLKPGARLLANLDRNEFPYIGVHPLFVTWELPVGSRVFACTGGLVFIGAASPAPWDYYGDVFSNLMIYLDGRRVPQDIELVHSVRTQGFEITMRKSLLLALLEFAESFGANTRGVTEELDALDEMISGAREAYADLRFREIYDIYVEIGDILDALEDEAFVLKNRALLWVHFIEWLIVSGTGLSAGFVLWSTMVHRRLYREVASTRLGALPK